jgi:hypothetical protein
VVGIAAGDVSGAGGHVVRDVMLHLLASGLVPWKDDTDRTRAFERSCSAGVGVRSIRRIDGRSTRAGIHGI